MATGASCLVATVSVLQAVWILPVTPGGVVVEDTATEALRVRVYNHAGISGAEIEGMIATASGVLGMAGIRLATVLCSPLPEGSASPADCGAAIGPADMILEVLLSPPTITPHALGGTNANEGGPMTCRVYHRFALQLAQQYGGVRVAELLGYALAHEIGHTLLGTNKHSAGGIMKARFSRRDVEDMARGWLRFTPREARRLRQNLRARIATQITRRGR